MRILSFTILFRIAVSASLPLGTFNRLSLHVAGLSPNTKAHNVPFVPSSRTDSVVSDRSDTELCASPPSRNYANFPSLSTVFECRGGHTMNPIEDALKPVSVPIRVFGFELSLFGLKLLLQMGLTLLNVVCWWLPLRTKSFSQNDNLMALANTFSAGTILCLFNLILCLFS
jgi:hypothetical protein